jgi:hypothetical protein
MDVLYELSIIRNGPLFACKKAIEDTLTFHAEMNKPGHLQQILKKVCKTNDNKW